MKYSVTMTESSKKELNSITSVFAARIIKAIWTLAENPRPNGSRKLKGKKEYLWRIRVGDYRVIYSIEDTVKIVEIRRVGHRRDVYEP
jgi:mRNA interferase RelE/StbE